jgi:hypothetical protein
MGSLPVNRKSAQEDFPCMGRFPIDGKSSLRREVCPYMGYGTTTTTTTTITTTTTVLILLYMVILMILLINKITTTTMHSSTNQSFYS